MGSGRVGINELASGGGGVRSDETASTSSDAMELIHDNFPVVGAMEEEGSSRFLFFCDDRTAIDKIVLVTFLKLELLVTF